MNDIYYLEDYREPLNISFDSSESFIVKPDKLRVRFPNQGATLEFDEPNININEFRMRMFSIGQNCLSVR